jgi:hypothetical protein
MGRKNNDVQADEIAVNVSPRNPRAATLLRADCIRADGESIPMRVRNLSETGFGGLCESVVDFDSEEAVKIHFPHMSPVKAVIKWYAGKEAGVQFNKHLDLKRIADARAAAATPSPVHGLPAAAEGFWQGAQEQALPNAKAQSKPAAPAKLDSDPAWQPPALNFGKRKAG